MLQFCLSFLSLGELCFKVFFINTYLKYWMRTLALKSGNLLGYWDLCQVLGLGCQGLGCQGLDNYYFSMPSEQLGTNNNKPAYKRVYREYNKD